MHHPIPAVGLALLMVTAGCLGFVTGEQPLTGEATPATVTEDARSAAGYELARATELPVNRTVTVAGETRQIRVVNHLAEYHKAVELGALGTAKAAVFAAVSTPAFEVAGRTLNPVGDMSNRELAGQFQSQYSDVSIGEEVDSRDVATLDGAMTLSKFEGEATFQGRAVPVYVHVGKIRHGGDFVVVVALYPQRVPGQEEAVVRMVRGLDHDG